MFNSLRTVYVTLFGMSFYSSWDLQNLSTLSWWTSVHRVVSSTPLHAWALSCVHSLQPHGPCSPPGSSVHKLFQVRMLERVVTASSWRSSPPRNWTQVSWVFCVAGVFITTEPFGMSYLLFQILITILYPFFLIKLILLI